MSDFSALSLAQIRARFRNPDIRLSADQYGALERDPRRGVRELAAQLRRREAAGNRARRRLSELLVYETRLWADGLKYIAGVDEAGMGPLAGPVVAAAVIFPPGSGLVGVDDSKALSPSRRERLAGAIRASATCIAIGIATVEEIDRINIYQAGLLAMRRAVAQLAPSPQHLLIDARSLPEITVPQTALIRGDQHSFSIAAASIIAKTTRDQIMCDLDRQFPGYGLSDHKGYPTPLHQAALATLGLSPCHRRTFSITPKDGGRQPAVE